jgi:hypothetical protein
MCVRVSAWYLAHLNKGGWLVDGDSIWLKRVPVLDAKAANFGHFGASVNVHPSTRRTARGDAAHWMVHGLKSPGDRLRPTPASARKLAFVGVRKHVASIVSAYAYVAQQCVFVRVYVRSINVKFPSTIAVASNIPWN